MLALSLLLCAAGVKAMLGIKIEAIQISDNEYFCADACAFDDAFFQDDGTVCAAKCQRRSSEVPAAPRTRPLVARILA